MASTLQVPIVTPPWRQSRGSGRNLALTGSLGGLGGAPFAAEPEARRARQSSFRAHTGKLALRTAGSSSLVQDSLAGEVRCLRWAGAALWFALSLGLLAVSGAEGGVEAAVSLLGVALALFVAGVSAVLGQSLPGAQAARAQLAALTVLPVLLLVLGGLNALMHTSFYSRDTLLVNLGALLVAVVFALAFMLSAYMGSGLTAELNCVVSSLCAYVCGLVLLSAELARSAPQLWYVELVLLAVVCLAVETYCARCWPRVIAALDQPPSPAARSSFPPFPGKVEAAESPQNSSGHVEPFEDISLA
jgi:hypothetical protein